MNQINNIEKALIPFKKIVMICSHCGDQFKSSQTIGAVERIKSELKTCVKERLEKGEVRGITTSCLSICPENKIAIAILAPQQSTRFEGLIVDPEISKEQLFDQILINL